MINNSVSLIDEHICTDTIQFEKTYFDKAINIRRAPGVQLIFVLLPPRVFTYLHFKKQRITRGVHSFIKTVPLNQGIITITTTNTTATNTIAKLQ